MFALLGGGGTAVSGVGFFQNIGDNFQYTSDMALFVGLEGFWRYNVLIISLLFVISGIFLLIGMKYRVASIFGAIAPLIVGIIFILGIASDIAIMDQLALTMIFMMSETQIGDVFPVVVNIGDYGLGLFLIVGGAVLGIIAAALPREDMY
ncbi:MAG: hypothetical protein KGD63_00530 [Candidatus Lokiarchaeota archaeon]|nr:hypothetical protein [Candidatus Lokiarchaeota archaeon]